MALVLSLLSCYGTLAAIAVLSALGITLSVPTGIWAGMILFFVLLTTLVVIRNGRRLGRTAPRVTALAGSALIAYAMLVDFDRIVELSGFTLLALAVGWDWRLRPSSSPTPAAPTDPPSSRPL